MMNGMMDGMMLGGWLGVLIALLVVVLLGLGIAALIKYRRSPSITDRELSDERAVNIQRITLLRTRGRL